MNLLVVLTFFSVMLARYLVEGVRILPGYAKLLPELMSAIALLVVLARLLGGSRIRLDWRYGLFFGLLFFIIFFGFFAQSMDAGPMVGGLRFYLKALPFFLLPAVYPFTERQIKVQFVWLFLLVCLQTPVAFYQKYVQFRTMWHTGDNITGTVAASGQMSIIMVCTIAALVVLYLRDKLRFIPFLIGVGFLLAPTTINETKITLILLPLVVALPALFMPRGQRSLRKLVPILVTGGVAVVTFFSVYAYYASFQKYGQDLGSFVENKTYKNYLLNGGDKHRSEIIGRGDTLIYAYNRIKQDPLVFAFGVGAGNASRTQWKIFEGKYSKLYTPMGIGQTQVTYFLWEIGFVGLFAYLFLFYSAFRDAVFLSRSDSPFAHVGQAWATAVVILGISLLYESIMGMDELQYAFWFYSGFCATKAWELRAAARAAPTRRLTAQPGRSSVQQPVTPVTADARVAASLN